MKQCNRQAVNHMKHVQFRSRVKLYSLIKVEVYLLFEFAVGRVRGTANSLTMNS